MGRNTQMTLITVAMDMIMTTKPTMTMMTWNKTLVKNFVSSKKMLTSLATASCQKYLLTIKNLGKVLHWNTFSLHMTMMKKMTWLAPEYYNQKLFMLWLLILQMLLFPLYLTHHLWNQA